MNEKKIARLCWNTANWTRPSGPRGKAKPTKDKNGKIKSPYEYSHGFGHEEWLLDTSKIFNGCHYGFIQGIGQHYKKYQRKIFDISLYSIDSVSKTRWWIGEIRNAIVIDPKEIRSIKQHYKKQGWLKEMEGQLKEAKSGGKYKVSGDIANFNIKFAVNDLKLQDPPIQFDANDKAVSSNYYNLLNYVSEPDPVINSNFGPTPNGSNPKKKIGTNSYEGKSRQINLKENELHLAVYSALCKKYGKKNIWSEESTGYGTSVDLIAKEKDGSYTFYELKILGSPLMCIRSALSQLLEYAFYPDQERAKKLIIISHHEITRKIQLYMKRLRGEFKIPIFYQRYDFERDQLDATEY